MWIDKVSSKMQRSSGGSKPPPYTSLDKFVNYIDVSMSTY